MIGLDTNILLRFLTGDDSRQTAIAAQGIARETERNRRIYINLIVLCETLWMLRSRFGYSVAKLTNALHFLMASDEFVLEDRPAIENALGIFRNADISFADILIGLRNRKAGCATTLTFDKSAAALDEFTFLA